MRSTGLATGTLAVIGAGAAAALVRLAVAGHPGPLVPAALPAAFLVAGVVGGRARPDHRGVRLLLAVGTLHLLAFALSGCGAGDVAGTTAWALALLALAAYGAGFLALALLLATYPTGTLSSPTTRAFAAVATSALGLVLVQAALLSPAVPAVLEHGPAPVAAPMPLPLARLPIDGQPVLPLLVVAGAGVLVARARGADQATRRQLEWATLAAILLATLLMATPAATTVLPDGAWAGVFVATMSAVPFALLGGLVRHRLLDVDVLVVRTLARGVLVVGVLGCYAVAALVLGRSGSATAAVALTCVAALTGRPLLVRAEAVADRWVTAGRVRRGAMMSELAATLARSDPEQLPGHLCDTVREALDVSWVRLVLGDDVVAVSGQAPPDAEPTVRTPLMTAGACVGELHCGSRRAGWGRAELARLERVAPAAALALRDLELTRELEARVRDLTVSRARLVRAEETVRRQVERDLHDGVQQQLVALLTRLSVARELLEPTAPAGPALAASHELARQALADLRRLVAGIHPALLGDRGLTAAVEARAGLLPIAVTVDADPRVAQCRFPAEVEGAAFFVVSEALANVLKHSGADRARVVIGPVGGHGLRVAVSDEGSGTASYDGTGLAGLRDRVEALGGRFAVHATPGVGTVVVAEFESAPSLVGSDA